jgi:hypothetical protein
MQAVFGILVLLFNGLTLYVWVRGYQAVDGLSGSAAWAFENYPILLLAGPAILGLAIILAALGSKRD